MEQKRKERPQSAKNWIVENALALCAFDTFLPAAKAQARSAVSKRGG
jgi:hypothetical protein